MGSRQVDCKCYICVFILEFHHVVMMGMLMYGVYDSWLINHPSIRLVSWSVLTQLVGSLGLLSLFRAFRYTPSSSHSIAPLWTTSV